MTHASSRPLYPVFCSFQEKEKLRKQMEARVATMRAGLKRRLQEARAERTGTGSIPSPERVASGAGSGSGSSSSSSGPQ